MRDLFLGPENRFIMTGKISRAERARKIDIFEGMRLDPKTGCKEKRNLSFSKDEIRFKVVRKIARAPRIYSK